MIVDLDRKDIISLLKGTSPDFSVMHLIPKDLGYYCGGFVDKWSWNYYVPDKYSDKELYDFYLICKKSWA